MERRTFLQTAALSALAAVSTSPLSLGQRLQRLQERPLRDRRQSRRSRKIPIAVQVYSVRKIAEKDLAGTLEAIAKMGYDGVEFAHGFYGNDPKNVRKMLDDYGLGCAGTHTSLEQLRGDNFEKSAEIHKILGAKYMIVAWMDPKEMQDVEKNKRLAEEYSTLARKAKPLGLCVGYHAHGGDAEMVEGKPAWERFFDAASPDVVMQMDIGNYMMAGGDPYKMIEKFKGRSKTIHLKEAGEDSPIIGSGTVDWNRSFKLCETIGGTEWYIVEDETADDLGRITQCIEALRAMGK